MFLQDLLMHQSADLGIMVTSMDILTIGTVIHGTLVIIPQIKNTLSKPILYDAEDLKLVWSGQSKTYNSSDLNTLAMEYVEAIKDELTKEGLLNQ